MKETPVRFTENAFGFKAIVEDAHVHTSPGQLDGCLFV
jgi:hypothetical protein